MSKNKLSIEDKKLLEFLANYRIISMIDAKKIYNSEWYYRKRLKKLVEMDYIKRYKYYYIVLSKNGRKFINLVGREYIKNANNEVYMERLKIISNIATLIIDSDIKFFPSWKIKDRNIFTETGRKYIGEMEINKNKYIVYYIDSKKGNTYIKQLIYDINKTINYQKLIIFVNEYSIIKNIFDNFSFDKKCSLIIKNSDENKTLIKRYYKIDFYEILKEIYSEVILVSNWNKADYVINDNHYIVNMTFMDGVKINELNWFYKENVDTEKIVDVVTLAENVNVLREILTNRCNLIELPKIGECENDEKMGEI